MDEKNKETPEFDEPSFEDFLVEEVDPTHERKKIRRKKVTRSVAGLIAFVFLISSFSVFANYFNLPALEFLKISYQLSKQEDIQRYKKAIVSVEGNNSKGTGFNISNDGIIITNYHVIEDMKNIVVYFSNEQVFKATLIKGYPDVDLAFLDIDGENLPVLPLASEMKKYEGDDIYVIGNPLAFYQIANRGETIGLRKVNNIKVSVLAITAPIFRGNSGSPVINKSGEVIGVVFATTIPSVLKKEEREGLVIPISEVLSRLP